MSKILITGGAGFIGSAVIAHFQKLNHELFVIDNLSFGNRHFSNIPDAAFFNEDILNKDRIFNIINNIKPDIIVHLAAIHFIPYCNEHHYDSSDINIRGTIHVLEAARKAGVKKVLLASTAAVYPIYD